MSALAPAPVSGARTPAGAERRVAKVAVLGASGYTGQEFIRLAASHPGIHLEALASREHAGEPWSTWLAGVDPRGTSLPDAVTPAAVADRVAARAVDTVVVCLPHGAWKTLAAEHPGFAAAEFVIDLSTDHRDGSEGYLYGLPEAFRGSLAGAARIANPGCYATAAALALLPAAEQDALAGPVTVSALSGVSGAGRGATLRTSFAELEGGASFYRVGTEHAHVAEIERTLDRLARVHRGAATGIVRRDPRPAVGFAPQLVPMTRGILLTASAALEPRWTPAEAHAVWAARYAAEPFVQVLPPGTWPETRAVCRGNRCDLAVTTIHEGATVLVTAALDNLVKGAAGQALQNLNLQLGWPEDTGLSRHGSPW